MHFERGASYSLRAAREACGDEPFLLVMSDHLLSSALLRKLVEAGEDAADDLSLVAVDHEGAFDATYVEEATKVDSEDGRVLAIGKELQEANGLDCGAFACTPAIWDAVDAAPEDCDLSTIFREAARRGQLGVADVSGCAWYDVDTEADIREAERRLRRGQARLDEPSFVAR
jgi:choline kinase